MSGNLTVMLSTEGTYPFHQGGVSTWCDILIQKLKSVDYVVYSVLMDPFVTQKFQLPEQTKLIKMPLWGTEEPSEHLNTAFSQTYMAKRRTDDNSIKRVFLPLFIELIRELISVNKDPIHFGHTLNALYEYFQTYEFKASFKSEWTWNTFKDIILTFSNDPGNRLTQPDLYSMIQSLGWVYRFFNILNTPVPKTHVSHASAAAFCGIPCVLAKLKNKTPFLLTEHGVYLREQYLSLAKREYSSFLNTFLIRMVHSITGLNYAFADQVSPVCQYNTRWEKRFEVEPDKIHVIYNGVDPHIFKEVFAPREGPLTVVTVARIDPIKDILTLIRSAAIVRNVIPEVKYVVYGSVSVPAYYEECLQLREELGLEDTFIFAGHTSSAAAAYQSGDVIALSSISEAFPYSVVEAMMSGKVCIATDVGGIREALGDSGILVKPFDAAALAEGTLKLLNDAELRESLARDAKERALNFFTLNRVLELHLKSYIKLAVKAKDYVPTAADFAEAAAARENVERVRWRKRQQLFLERGYTLLELGNYKEALAQFKFAIQEAPTSPSTPVLLLEIANVYNRLGQEDMARNELNKYVLICQLVNSNLTA